MKRISVVVLYLILFLTFDYGQGFSLREVTLEDTPIVVAVSQDDRDTAIAYMRFAKKCFEQSDFSSAFNYAKIGLRYDENISDLHYITAISAEKLGLANFLVLESMNAAFKKDDWILPDEIGSRIFYAEMLCRTNDFKIALDFLDTIPQIYSADVNFLRAKSLYMLGDSDKAFDVVATSTNIFPDDFRFPILFFTHEKPMLDSAKKEDYVSMILRNIAFWGDKTSEIYLAAVPFCETDEEQKNFLLAYQAIRKNDNSSVDLSFVAQALENGIIGEADALAFFEAASEKGFKFDDFLAVTELLRDETVCAATKKFLMSFSGILFFSSAHNNIYDIVAKYEHGRPQEISCDKNQDGFLEWNAICDLGLPSEIILNQGDFFVEYTQFPAVTHVRNANNEKFTVPNGSFFWSPLEIQSVLIFDDIDFFIPAAHATVHDFDMEGIFRVATKITVPIGDDENHEVRFTIADGKIYISEYFENNTLYARGIFEEGILKTRYVDKTGDGFFEITEIYEFSPEKYENFISEEEKSVLYNEIFGSLNVESGLYLSQVQVDATKNGFPDFIENYDSKERKVVYWSRDNGDTWIIRHVSDIKDGKCTELSEFRQPYTDERIMITSEDGVQTVRADDQGIVPIYEDKQFPIFWVNKVFGTHVAEEIIHECNKNPKKNVCIVTDSDGNVFRVISSGETYFAEVVNSEK